MIERIIFCCALLLMLPALAEEQRVDVAVKRVDVEGEQVFDVTASGTVKASPAVVWKILTDYERMPEFVPDLERTKILSRAGNKATVEQFGRAPLPVLQPRNPSSWSRCVDRTGRCRRSTSALVSGDMKVYRCRIGRSSPVPETGGTKHQLQRQNGAQVLRPRDAGIANIDAAAISST
jgi:hypothetical protein